MVLKYGVKYEHKQSSFRIYDYNKFTATHQYLASYKTILGRKQRQC